MEATETAAGAEATAATGSTAPPTLDAIYSGEAPISSLSQTYGEPAETPQAETPQPTPEAPKEGETAASPQETAPEAEAPDQTTEQEAEPLPQKIEDLLKAVKQANPKLGNELNRVVREDHFLLRGPSGFLSTFQGGIKEAEEYKTIAPTLEDLHVKDEFSTRYVGMDQQYRENPRQLVHTIARDPNGGIAPEFVRLAGEFEPAVRELGDPRVYELAGKPFVLNNWQNVTAWVERFGTPEEVELFNAISQKTGMAADVAGNGHRFGPQQYQQPTMQQPPQPDIQAEREAFQEERREYLAVDVDRTVTPMVQSEVRKYLEEKAGSSIPQDARSEELDEMSERVARGIWQEINKKDETGRPGLLLSQIHSMIRNGDLSPQHKQQVIDFILQRAKAWLPQKSAPEITRTMGRIRKLQGGTTNSKPTNQATAPQGASKDVGSGSPSVGGPIGAPRGFPPGWNAMKPMQKMSALEGRIDWRATEKNTGTDYSSAEELISAVCAGYAEPSRLVLKGNG